MGRREMMPTRFRGYTEACGSSATSQRGGLESDAAPTSSAAVRQNARRPCSRRGVPLACASGRAARTRPGDVDDHTNVVPAGLGKRGALLEGGGRRPFLCGHEAASRAAHLPPPLSAGPLERPIERCWREARSGRPERRGLEGCCLRGVCAVGLGGPSGRMAAPSVGSAGLTSGPGVRLWVPFGDQLLWRRRDKTKDESWWVDREQSRSGSCRSSQEDQPRCCFDIRLT